MTYSASNINTPSSDTYITKGESSRHQLTICYNNNIKQVANCLLRLITMTEEQPEKQRGRADHLKPHQFQKGVSGNPNGRKKGSKSLKTYAREYLETLSDEDKMDFMEGLDKKVVWEMAEGKPDTKTEIEGNVNISGNAITFTDGKSKTDSK